MELDLTSDPYSRTGDQFAVERNLHRAVDEVTDAQLRSVLGDRKYSACTYAGTGSPSVTITGVINFSIGGRMFTKASTTTASFSDLRPQKPGTTKAYLIGINASGVCTIVNGLELPALVTNIGGAVTGQGPVGPHIPPLPEGYAPVAAFTVTTGDATTFTPGTTNLNAAGVTTTFYDLAVARKHL